MRLYYKAVALDGKTIRGFIEAKDPREAAIYIRQKDLIPVIITEESGTGLLFFLKSRRRFSNKDLIFFTRQLSSMLGSGLTLMQALTILKNEVQDPYKSDVTQKIIESIEEGKPFYIALSQYPSIFSDIYVMVVKAAEESGLLDKILARLAETLEKREKLRSTVRAALFYPAIVIIVMIAVIIVMMTFVFPQLTAFYEQFENVSLPLSTQIVIGASNFFATFWYLIIAGLGVTAYGIRRWYRTETGKLLIDKGILRVPLIGKLIQQSIIVEFTRTAGLMIGTGSLVVDSLQKAAEIVGNRLYKNAILGVSAKVSKGITVGNALSSSPLFPAVLIEMVKIGEQTGKLDESLVRVSEYYEHEVDQTVKLITTAIEPIIIVVLAVSVGFLLFAILTPLYNIISALQ